MFPQWGVVGWAEGEVTNEPDNSLDKGPAAWWVKQLDKDWETVMETYCILGHLSLMMASSQMT